MEESIKKVVKKNKSNSSRNTKMSRKKEVSNLSNEELLEQILLKNKEKKAKKKSSSKSASNKSVKKVSVKKKIVKDTKEDELLLEEILKKNKLKKEKQKARRRSKNTGRLLVDYNTVENKIVQDIVKQTKEESVKEEPKDLIITKEIDLKEYLDEQKNVKPREDFVELEQELGFEKESKVLVDEEQKQKERDLKIEQQIEKEIAKKQKRKIAKSRVHFGHRFILPVVVLMGLVAIIVVGSMFILNKPSNAVKVKSININPYIDVGAMEAMHEICLNDFNNESDKSEEINVYVNELNEYLSGINASVYYYDMSRGFNYKYNEEANYYAASTVKALIAVYIYEQAANEKINLDDTLVYSSKYDYDESKYFDGKSFGIRTSIRDVVKYAIMYSDNSAYMMLIDYIGINILKDYAKNIGLNSFMDTDKFGHISAADGMIIVKMMNDIFNSGNPLGEELKGYFMASDNNDLKIDNLGIGAATKYGETAYVYNNIGIVYDEHPYALVVLTGDKSGDYEQKIRDINNKIYELHRLYYANRNNKCNELFK